VPEKQLHCSQVARFLIYLCRLGPSHRMRAIGRAIKPRARDPGMDDPGILPGRQVRLRSDPAGKEVPGAPASNVGKPQPRSLLSIARLNKARLRARRSTWSRTRIDHTSLGFRGRFCPIRRPLFQGSRCGTDGGLLSSMIVSSKPTAPSRLRSAEGRPGILSLGGRKTRPWFIGRQRVHAIRIGTLPVADRDHDCPPPRQAVSGRGSCARR
jgi:hypothetical protein